MNTTINSFSHGDVYRMGDELAKGNSHYESVFNELKKHTGISKADLKRIFRIRFTDAEIIRNICSKSPNMNIHEKCKDIKRLTMGTVNSETCLHILFRSLDVE